MPLLLHHAPPGPKRAVQRGHIPLPHARESCINLTEIRPAPAYTGRLQRAGTRAKEGTNADKEALARISQSRER